MEFAQVILPLNLAGTFTYSIPQDLQHNIQAGMRVLVQFGGKKIYTGIVWSLHNDKPETFVPKEIINILDQSAIVPPEQISFWNWLSDYYMCHLGEIYRFAFPSSLKLESETYLKLRPNVAIDFEVLDVNEMYLVQALEVRQLINLSDIEAFIPKKDLIKTINSLLDLQYIEIDEQITEKYKAKEVSYLKLADGLLESNVLQDLLIMLKRATKQKELLLYLVERQTESKGEMIKKSEVFEDGYFGNSHLKPLLERGWVEEYKVQKDRLDSYEGELEELESLSVHQKQALEDINMAFSNNMPVLLHGVTSSGKTHLYLEKIEDTISEGKVVLFLLPEIALTKQITQRLEKKYGNRLGFYHQKLTDFEKVEVWRRVKNREVDIIIGTRNALFLPYSNLGLVVVDEEHDSAYRPREVSPIFNARDAVQVLAKYYNSNLILGSATPSVESYYAAYKDKLRYVRLSQRFSNVNLPEYELINFKESQDAKLNVGDFSQQLIDHMQHQMDHHKQTMVLHNRRGYANIVECESCGDVSYCSNCDVVMTYHKYSNELKCHYCGHKMAKPVKCPKCQSPNLNTKGVGVEQIHEELIKIFPSAEIDRMDVDSMRKKFAYEKLYERIEEGKTDIVVGTQMISKGLDFDNIELVAIPRADALLYVQDFRAEERAYQLITQVSGRAGRKSGEGKIMIQTFNPTHPVFELLKKRDEVSIYNYFLNERKKFLYPPFVKLIMIELKHRREDKVNRASQFLSSILHKYLPTECVYGPEVASIARLNNMYQYQILLKLPRGKKYTAFKNLVKNSLIEFNEVKGYQSVKLIITVDF